MIFVLVASLACIALGMAILLSCLPSEKIPPDVAMCEHCGLHGRRSLMLVCARCDLTVCPSCVDDSIRWRKHDGRIA